MRILAIDVGTGTQDILFYDSDGPIENSPKLVMPSPTATAARHIREATARGAAVVLTGVNSGGGPSHWALNDHLKSGAPAYATPQSASTFDDDLTRVEADGVVLVSEDEAARLDGEHVRLRDVDIEAVRTALVAFGADDPIDGLAIGVLDHGAAPPDVSDRLFRFQHMERVLSVDPDLRAFSWQPDDLPDYLTRARSALDSTPGDVPTVFMDNGPAAALGALHDPAAGPGPQRRVLNVGNMHALGYILTDTRVDAVFEHHTGEITSERLAAMAAEIEQGDLSHEDVFGSQGHGVLYLSTPPFAPVVTLITGPRRAGILPRLPQAVAAAPHGDMMISGCFGLLDGYAYRIPEAADAVARLHTETAPIG